MDHQIWLYLTSLSLLTYMAIVVAETDVTYRGRTKIKNKDGVEINGIRWSLSPAKLERPEHAAKQDCKIVSREHGRDRSEADYDPEETLLRCSTDDEPPQISACPPNIKSSTDIEEASALITWTNPTAADDMDPNPTITCTPSSGNRFNIGTTDVVCEALDRSGNKATCGFTVSITDNENPKISGCPSEISRPTDPGQTTAVISWTNPTAEDNSDPNPYVDCTPATGSEFNVGITEVICKATDDSGNTDTCEISIYVTVIGGWSNSRSAVRCNTKNAFEVITDTPNLLRENESTELYVSFADDVLRVGRVGEDPFISHQITCPVHVNYIGIASGFGYNAYWTFCGFGDDCNTLRSRYGYDDDGLYSIYLSQSGSFVEMYCDMSTDNETWIVFQKRFDGSEDFNRNWDNYTKGFGSMNGEFWWGLENLQSLTAQGSWQLRVDIEDWENNTAYAEYESFAIEGPLFRLVIGEFIHGNAGNMLNNYNGSEFSTYDNDNDIADGNCAVNCHGGGWHKHCCGVNLNGKYYDNPAMDAFPRGLLWKLWKESTVYSMKSSQMKLRRTD